MRLILFFLIVLHTQTIVQSQPEILRKKGLEFKGVGQYDSALYYYNLAFSGFANLHDSTGLANVYTNIASLESQIGNYVYAYEVFQNALTIYKEIGESAGVIRVYINVANQHLRIGNLEEALREYLKAEQHSIESNQKQYLGSIYNGIGSVLVNKSFEDRDIDKAKDYYMEALVIFESNSDLKNSARIYNNLALIFEEKEQIPQAIEAYNKSVLIGEKEKDLKTQLIGNYNIGRLYLLRSEYELSLEHLQKAEELAIQLPDPITYVHILSNLVDVNMNLGNLSSAKEYLIKYKSLKDSLYNEDKSEALTDLQIKYKTKEKEELLAKEIELGKETKLRNTFLMILLILLLVVLVLIVLINRRRRQHDFQRAKNEQEIISLKSRIEGENEERKRLSSDLHDSVGGMLTAVKMIHFSYMDAGGEKASKVDQLLNEVSKTVREVSHNLSSSTLERYGLEKSIDHVIESIEGEIEVQFSFNIDEKLLNKELKKTIDFVVKELINNSIKHSNALTIDLQINYSEGSLLLTYEDDGKGFDLEKLSEGMGLVSITNRIDLVNGILNFDSSPGEGFVCSIEVEIQ